MSNEYKNKTRFGKVIKNNFTTLLPIQAAREIFKVQRKDVIREVEATAKALAQAWNAEMTAAKEKFVNTTKKRGYCRPPVLRPNEEVDIERLPRALL